MNLYNEGTAGGNDFGAGKTDAATVLVMGAKELNDTLAQSFGEKVNIAVAEGLKDGNEAMARLMPKLLICALEGESWEIIPLLHNARQHRTPILAVAYNQEAVASSFSLEWVVDRSRKDAVVALAEKLLEDPGFVPDDPSTYPPPPPTALDTTETAPAEPVPESRVKPHGRPEKSSGPPPVLARPAQKASHKGASEKEDDPPSESKKPSTFPAGSVEAFEVVERLNVKVVAETVKSLANKVLSLDALVNRVDDDRHSDMEELISQLHASDGRISEIGQRLEGLLERLDTQGRQSEQRVRTEGDRVGLVESQLVELGRRLNEAKRLFVEEHGAAENHMKDLDTRLEERVRDSELLSQFVEDRVALLETQIGALVRTVNETRQRFEDGRDAEEKRLEKLEAALSDLPPASGSPDEPERLAAQVKDLGLTLVELDDRIGFVETRVTGMERSASTDDAAAEERVLRQLEEIRTAQKELSGRIAALEKHPPSPPAATPQHAAVSPVGPGGVPFAVPRSSAPPAPAAAPSAPAHLSTDSPDRAD